VKFVTREFHDALIAERERMIASLEAQLAEAKVELVKERDAARSAMASAMATARLGNPYKQGGVAPIAKPIGRERARQIVDRLEREERELVEKKKDNGPADAAAAVN
jgi:hypothetical protein